MSHITSKKIFILFVLVSFISLALFLSFASGNAPITPVANDIHVDNNETNISIDHENKVSNTDHADPLIANITNASMHDLDDMLKKRTIRVLVVPSEIMFHVDKGKKSGFSYEYMKAFEKQINTNFRQKNKQFKTRVVFIPVSHNQLIPQLIQGRGDIAMANTSITDTRKKKVDFTNPYATNVNVITVTGPSSPKLHTLDDLSGQEIYVRRASSYYEYLKKLNVIFTNAGKEAIKIKTIPEHLESKDVLEMLNAGLIGITVIDKYKAQFWSKVLPKITLHTEITLKTDDTFAWMIRKNSPKLMKEANLFIKKHKKGTLMGNILMNRYTKNFKFEKPSVSKKKLEKFDKVVKLFKKYADQYDLNYHLIIAQAYQESKLNQKAKSKAGAVGMMQLLPNTGKSMKVGNINKLEPNIHAGVKYHRWLVDRYFKTQEMDTLNQTFFAFAAYNAGPSRVIKLRNIAKKRGYNPNVWFDNVEMIAAEKIGAETVTYVSNIYEYYVAYTLYEEQKRVKSKLLQ